MLRFQQLVNMGIASILVIPAVALQDDGSRGLEDALEDTIAALDHLVVVQQRLESGDPAARDLILAATEEPLAAGVERDRYLDQLRRDVNVLTSRLETAERDQPERRMIDPNAPFTVEPGSAAPTARTDSDHVGQPTTGLSEETRERLAGIQAPLPGVTRTQHDKAVQIEDEGFLVDLVLMGRSYFRAGRLLEGAELLAREPENAEAIYWRGRCLEKLERYDEAIEAYGKVVAKLETGYLADRARNDMDFLTWKREFESKLGDARRGN